MSGLRFGLLVAALGLLVAAGSFAVGLAVLDGGGPDPPPVAGGATATTPVPIGGASSTTVATIAPPGALVTPAWITVVASEGDEGAARETADLVAARGYPTGVLRSDDYPSLTPGFWVAYAGPYPDRRAADAAVGELAADGIGGAYVRCAGSTEECSGDDD